MWLKIWFDELEVAESVNGDFFEVIEEDIEYTEIEGGFDILEEGTSENISKMHSQENRPISDTQSLTPTECSYFDPPGNQEDFDASGAISYFPNKSKPSWLTYEDTHEIRQHKWSDISPSVSSSISVMSTASNSS